MLITSKDEPVQALIPPALLEAELPISERAAETVYHSRGAISAIIHANTAKPDNRLFTVVGPSSIHDVAAAHDYAALLAEEAAQYKNQLHIAMRVYFEKSHTTSASGNDTNNSNNWKGLINDPDRDHSFQINKGLRLARRLLIEINESGLSCACSIVDTISPNFIGDLISWGGVSPSATESQNHRQLCSGISAAVGFNNGSDGDIQIAVDAIGAAKHPHCFLGVTKQGLSAILTTKGNTDCHLILRGGKTDGASSDSGNSSKNSNSNSNSNFDIHSVVSAVEKLDAAGLATRVMVDCGHANSDHDHRQIPNVISDLSAQIRAGNQHIMGLIIPSNLHPGQQTLNSNSDNNSQLKYGQSISDPCIGWDDTRRALASLATAVDQRHNR